MQCCTGKACAAHDSAGSPQNQNFGMGGGIMEFECAVAGSGKQATIGGGDHGADGHFATRRCRPCLGKRGGHLGRGGKGRHGDLR